MRAGPRDTLVTFYRTGPEVDDGYTTKPGEPAVYATAWCEVIYGRSEEKRQAAQEGAALTATFRTEWDPVLLELNPTDTLVIDGDTVHWDIQSPPIPRKRDAVEVVASRAA